jgi:hypothetical protein
MGNMNEDERILLTHIQLDFIAVGWEDVWIQLLRIATRGNFGEYINSRRRAKRMYNHGNSNDMFSISGSCLCQISSKHIYISNCCADKRFLCGSL